MKPSTFVARVALVLAVVPGLIMAAAPGSNEAVVEGMNAFAVDIYGKLTESEKANIFVSPASIETALAMTYAGARGQTAVEMSKALHFGKAGAKLHQQMGDLTKRFNSQGKDKGYQLSVANALWVQKGYPLLDGFKTLTAKHYEANLFDVDFAQADDAAKLINNWVEKRTNERIKNLFDPSDLAAETRLVLTNAIYFKADWADKFEKEATKPADFFLTADKKAKVPTMDKTAMFAHFAGDGFAALAMPYKKDQLSMVILLPNDKAGLAAFEKKLTAATIDKAIAGMKRREVHVRMPKFRMEWGGSLVCPLHGLGMQAAFGAGADFSGMTAKPELFISAVIHKTFVDVNEEGTEAAGATGVGMAFGAAAEPPKPIQFHADHPFVFLIRDNASGAILFIGRLVEPPTEK